MLTDKFENILRFETRDEAAEFGKGWPDLEVRDIAFFNMPPGGGFGLAFDYTTGEGVDRRVGAYYLSKGAPSIKPAIVPPPWVTDWLDRNGY